LISKGIIKKKGRVRISRKRLIKIDRTRFVAPEVLGK